MLADPSRATAEAALGATGFPLILLVGMGPRVPNTIEGRRHPRTTFQSQPSADLDRVSVYGKYFKIPKIYSITYPRGT